MQPSFGEASVYRYCGDGDASGMQALQLSCEDSVVEASPSPVSAPQPQA